MIYLNNPIKQVQKGFRFEHCGEYQGQQIDITLYYPDDILFKKWFNQIIGSKVESIQQKIQMAHLILWDHWNLGDISRMSEYDYISDNDKFEILHGMGIEFDVKKITIMKNRFTGIMGNCYLIKIPDETHRMALKLAIG